MAGRWERPVLAAAVLVLAYELLRSRRREAAARAEAARAVQLRSEERAGRTAAERKLRQQQQLLDQQGEKKPTPRPGAAPLPACTYRPIGRIASCYGERRGCPRQGMLVPAARAHLKLLPGMVQPAAALEGLEGFSHVWLLYDFHENTNASKLGDGPQQLRAKVHPPGLGGARTGLFSTRTPHRPNPIGLSVARLIELRGDTLVLGGADLIDGTPVLDIKPYLRHDLQPDASVPEWCERRTDSSQIAEVRFSAEADEQLARLVPRLRFYEDVAMARDAVCQTLQLDIRSVHQGRGRSSDGQRYEVHLDALAIEFSTFDTHVLVTRCALGAASRSPNAAEAERRG